MWHSVTSRVWHARRWLVAALLASSAVAGCGGGGSSSDLAGTDGCVPSDPSASAQCGVALVSLTDADGDFVSYTVDILSLKLVRPDGGSVEMLPASTRIDFAQLTDLSELVSAAAVAPGEFVGGTLRLDYSNAEIDVEAGGQVVKAQAVDAQGQALGVTELKVQLADRDHLLITRGRAVLLSLDFNLAASNEVDTSSTPPIVKVQPFIVAEAAPSTQKDLRVRGALASVDVPGSSYTVHVRPWVRRAGDHGGLTVHTDSATSFEIGTATYVGSAGLEALAGLDPGVLTVAFGRYDAGTHAFTASTVQAGPSVAGADVDAVEGDVVARNGDVLTVRGGWALWRDRAADFRRTVTVRIGPDTRVFKVGGSDLLDETAVSVGQRIVAFGSFEAPAAAAENPADEPLVLDATQGRVRMLVTRLNGTVKGVNAGRLELELQSIDHLGADLFDFSGTGTVADGNSDPNDYEVAIGTLGLAGFAEGQWTSVLGFVAPFGAAPPDFDAQTVVSRPDALAALSIGWGTDGTPAPFVTMEPAALVLDLTNPSIGRRHVLRVAGESIDLLGLPASPTIAPSASRGAYGIAEPGHIELFADFAEFVQALSDRLGGGQAALSLAAFGRYDAATNTVTATNVAVQMAGVAASQ